MKFAAPLHPGRLIRRYKRFLAYGEADAYEAKLEEFRVALGRVK